MKCTCKRRRKGAQYNTSLPGALPGQSTLGRSMYDWDAAGCCFLQKYWLWKLWKMLTFQRFGSLIGRMQLPSYRTLYQRVQPLLLLSALSHPSNHGYGLTISHLSVHFSYSLLRSIWLNLKNTVIWVLQTLDYNIYLIF